MKTPLDPLALLCWQLEAALRFSESRKKAFFHQNRHAQVPQVERKGTTRYFDTPDFNGKGRRHQNPKPARTKPATRAVETRHKVCSLCPLPGESWAAALGGPGEGGQPFFFVSHPYKQLRSHP